MYIPLDLTTWTLILNYNPFRTASAVEQTTLSLHGSLHEVDHSPIYRVQCAVEFNATCGPTKTVNDEVCVQLCACSTTGVMSCPMLGTCTPANVLRICDVSGHCGCFQV